MKFERYLTQHDAAILGRLAEQLLRVRDLKLNAGEQLTELISSAILLPADVSKKNCIRLFSEVHCSKLGSGETFTVTIVSPEDANQSMAWISVLSPIGMALIGRKVNSTIEVQLPFCQTEFVKVLGVGVQASTPLATAID
jgi:regulator of nucleoside diphosphate kinase